MLKQGLDIEGMRGNPWNETEAGDNYARALASWDLVLALVRF